MQENETTEVSPIAETNSETTDSNVTGENAAENPENQAASGVAENISEDASNTASDGDATGQSNQTIESGTVEAPAEPEEEEEITYHAVQKEDSVTAIWEMQGRKHIRTIDPRSREGAEILRLFTAEEGEEAAAA